METLPDLLRPGLDIVFVGINPGGYSAKVGHYFATPQNRFWGAVNRSGLVPGEAALGPMDDVRMGEFGIGFTDVVKRASSSASDLRAADYRRWAPEAKTRLLESAPLVVCFNGLTGYKNYLRYADDVREAPKLGAQERRIGQSRVFVAPNPSPANAAFSLDVIAGWYRELGQLRDSLKAPGG